MWIDILRTDRRAKAAQAARIIRDRRVQHFHDPQRLAGGAIAQSLGANGPIAWDIYLFYSQDAVWETDPPRPIDWIHQLWGRTWAGPDRYRRGRALRQALTDIYAGLLPMAAEDPRL